MNREGCRLGFTGTQVGWSDAQITEVGNYIRALLSGKPIVGHHGDCVGSDEMFHDLLGMLKQRLIIHPPTIPSKRAFCDVKYPHECFVMPELPYLDRNRQIVDETDRLLATPKGPEELRSGTWATIRYAKKLSRPIRIIYPDGKVEEHN